MISYLENLMINGSDHIILVSTRSTARMKLVLPKIGISFLIAHKFSLRIFLKIMKENKKYDVN